MYFRCIKTTNEPTASNNKSDRPQYFEIERDFFNKLGVLIYGDFKFGVLLLVFVRLLGGDTGNLYRNGFL